MKVVKLNEINNEIKNLKGDLNAWISAYEQFYNLEIWNVTKNSFDFSISLENSFLEYESSIINIENIKDLNFKSNLIYAIDNLIDTRL